MASASSQSDPMLRTVLDALRSLATQNGDAEFLITDHATTLTYRACRSLSEGPIAESLSSCIQRSTNPRSLSPELPHNGQVRIAVLAPNGPLVPLVFWAAWHLDAVVCPLSTSAEPHLWASMIRKLDAPVVLVASDLLDRLTHTQRRDSFNANIVTLESLIPGLSLPASMSEVIYACHGLLRKAERSDAVVHRTITPADAALVMFTSSPVDEDSIKAVFVDHGSLFQGGLRIVRMFGQEYGAAPKRHLGWLPLGHVFEVTCGLFGHVLHTAGSFVFFDAKVSSPEASADLPLPELLLRALDYHNPIDSLCMVPFVIDYVYARNLDKHVRLLQQVKAISAGGAPTSDDVWRWCKSSKIPVANLYGITEAAGGVAGRGLLPGDGFTLMEGLMGVVEKEAPEDDFGELLIVSKYIAQGYLIGFRDAFSAHPQEKHVTVYRTGDCWRVGSEFSGHIILHGDNIPPFDPSVSMSGIYYTSRVDDQVILASGIKIDALAMEHLLNMQDEIKCTAIVASRGKTTLLALVEPSPAHRSDLDAVVSAIFRVNLSLPYEKRIQRGGIVLVDSLPVTTKGTLHRKRIKKILSENEGRWPIEETLAQVPDLGSVDGIKFVSVSPTPEIPLDMRASVQVIIADILSIPMDHIRDPKARLSDLSMSSLAVVRLAKQINDTFGCDIKHADIYESQTVDALCSRILSYGIPPSVQPAFGRAVPAESIKEQFHSRSDGDALIISGASCRFPNGVHSMDDLWNALVAPASYTEALSRPASSSRWNTEEPGSDLPMAWLDDENFQNVESLALFFGLPPSEVKAVPPNGRFILQMAYSALEDAGIAPKSLNGKPWGVFTSMNDSGWKEQRLPKEDSSGCARLWYTSAEGSAGARLSYHLNLTGPAMEIKTACSSSAVAIHQACRAIQNGDCEAAIVVASTTFFAAPTAVFRKQAGIASPSGRCATFSDTADGFLPSEGTAAIVIQRAKDASRPPYCRIRGSAVTQDGRSLGFAAPNPDAQVRLLQTGLRNANCDPSDVSYIEAHGTGTRVGDVIEFNSINKVYGQRTRNRPLIVGSVKAVIGHTEECAGLAGILKSILCFKHGIIPAQPHIRAVNPELDLYKARAIIPRSALGFQEGTRKRIISLSSFGLSGTLANIILEEPPKATTVTETGQASLFLLSARSENDFQLLLQRYISYCSSAAAMQTNLIDACRTTQLGRDHFLHRRAFMVSGWKELFLALQASAASGPVHALNNPTVSVWFTLPHAHYRRPSLSHPVYDRHMQQCRTNGCGPALEAFGMQLALARTLEDLGCQIVTAGGEGIAEYCAAALAGVISDQTLFTLLGSLQPTEGRTWCTDVLPEDLEDYLLDYRVDQIRIVGHCSGISYLHSSTDWLDVQSGLGFTTLREAHPLTCSKYSQDMEFHIETHQARLGIVSAYLGEALDEETYRSSSYWLDLPLRYFDGQKAQSCLFQKSDMIFRMRDSRTPLVSNNDKLVEVGGTLEDMLVKLYELGCSISWRSYSSSGPTCSLPTYAWSSDESQELV